MAVATSIGWKLTVGIGATIAAIGGLVTPLAVKAQQPAAASVTFSKDIAPILQRSCQNCHRPDGVAPMSLVTYDEVRPYAKAINQRTHIGPHRGVMPPGTSRRTSGSSTTRTIRR